MSFLDLKNKSFLVLGVANRKSVAWAIGRTLEGEGAKVVYSVRSKERMDALTKLLEGRAVYVCDVEAGDLPIPACAAVLPVANLIFLLAGGTAT